jgi:hypothetical protein
MIATLKDDTHILIQGDIESIIQYLTIICYTIAEVAKEEDIELHCGFSIEKEGLMYKASIYIEKDNVKMLMNKKVLSAAVEYINSKSPINN